MNLLFSHLDQLDTQVILKRLTDRAITLSPDDIVLEGYFSPNLVSALSRAFPPPLSFKVEVSQSPAPLRSYAAFEWEPQNLLYCGVSLLTFSAIQEMLELENAWQYLRLLTTTEVGSLLKPLLAVKPKGLISVDKNYVEFILPMHRMDFLLAWIDKLISSEVDLNWLSGSTGELDEELRNSVGSINQSRLPVIRNWVGRTDTTDDLDFGKLFSRSMIALS